MSNEALKEVGKSFMSFANLFTALSIVNIYLKEEQINIFTIIATIYLFIGCYTTGYLFIKLGDENDLLYHWGNHYHYRINFCINTLLFSQQKN